MLIVLASCADSGVRCVAAGEAGGVDLFEAVCPRGRQIACCDDNAITALPAFEACTDAREFGDGLIPSCASAPGCVLCANDDAEIGDPCFASNDPPQSECR